MQCVKSTIFDRLVCHVRKNFRLLCKSVSLEFVRFLTDFVNLPCSGDFENSCVMDQVRCFWFKAR
jgi:hypothetical protein